VVEEVKAKRTEIEEGREQSPVLSHVSACLSAQTQHPTYLTLEENRPDAVEQLERRDDVTLHQHTCAQRGRHPPASAYGHFVEPLLERKASDPSHHAIPALQNIGHTERSSMRAEMEGFCGFRNNGCVQEVKATEDVPA